MFNRFLNGFNRFFHWFFNRHAAEHTEQMRDRGGAWGAHWENEVADMLLQRDKEDALQQEAPDSATRTSKLWEAVENFSEGLMKIEMDNR